MTARSHRFILLALTLVGCGDDSSSADQTGDTGDTGDSGESSDTGDGVPVPGPAAGWARASAPTAMEFDCDADEAAILAAGAASLAFGSTTLYVGAEANNQGEQDSVIARFDAGILTYCVHHETANPNSTALGLTWDGGATAYLSYAVYSAGNGFEDLGGWLTEYSPGPISGVGAQAMVVGRVDVDTGALDRATFVIAVTPDQKVGDLLPNGAPTVLEDGSVELVATSEHSPIDADATTAMVCTEASHTAQYLFSGDLSELVCASATGCTATQDCG